MIQKQNLTETEASEQYGPSVAWFRRARWKGGGPEFIKLPGRAGRVLYSRTSLDAFFADRVRRSTSDPGPSAKTTQNVNPTSRSIESGRDAASSVTGFLPHGEGQGGAK